MTSIRLLNQTWLVLQVATPRFTALDRQRHTTAVVLHCIPPPLLSANDTCNVVQAQKSIQETFRCHRGNYRARTHIPCNSRVRHCARRWVHLPLQENCKERRSRVSPGMVSFCFFNVRLQLSCRAIGDLLFASWFSIGDWYPERNLFQILIALAAGAFCDRNVF